MKRQSQFDAGRVSAISDGIFAIAMTLLVLDVKLPELEPGISSRAFASAVIQQGPRFLSWLLSFAILARLWIIQHGLLAEGDTRSRGFVGWTFLFLGAVSFTPFPTSLLSEHHDQALSIWIFSATLAVAGIGLLGMWRAEQATEEGRPSPEDSPRGLMFLLLATAVVSSGVALASPTVGVWVWAAFPIVAVVLARHGR
jgi:uncharacterized membrane protein